MATQIVNGYRLIRKSDGVELERWTSVPNSIVVSGATYFNVPTDFDIGDYKIEPFSWTINVPDPPTIEQIIDGVFPQTGVAKALFEALFEIANRLQALESKSPITRAQLRDWLISKAQ